MQRPDPRAAVPPRPGVRLAAQLRRARRARRLRRRAHRGGGRRAAGDGLRDGRRAAAAVRPLHRDRDDRRRRALRLVAAAHQRPDQRDLDRGAQRARAASTARTRRSRRRCCSPSWWASIQLGITLLRLGDLTRYISHSVIVGFTLGASALLVLDQLKNLLGLQAVGDAHDHFLLRFWLTLTEGGGIHAATAADRARHDRAGARAALAEGAARLAAAARAADRRRRDGGRSSRGSGSTQRGVKVVGEIPAKLPSLRSCPRSTRPAIREFSTGALAIAVLGLLEAISMAKAIAAQTRPEARHEPAVPERRAREPRRQLLPVHARLGLADALGDQPAGRRVDAVVGRRLGGGGRADHARCSRPTRASSRARRWPAS